MRISQSGARDDSIQEADPRKTTEGGSTEEELESKNVDEIDDEEDEVDQKYVHGVLSQGLMSMSISDRNAVLEEIHGVRCLAVQETPELLLKSLQEFERELEKENVSTSDGCDPSSKRFAYQLILNRHGRGKRNYFGCSYTSEKVHPGHPSYNYAIDDENFRLRFLRCELFDVSKAVKRFYNYLNYVYEYWGDVALKRPIRMKDFTKAELKLFRRGFCQLLPFRDSSGRRVMVILGAMEAHQDIRARDKIWFYLWDVVTRDSVESQQRGFVIVRLHGNVSTEGAPHSAESSTAAPSTTNFRSVIKNLNRSLSSIPSRLVAMHTRVPNHPGFRLVWKLFVTRVFAGENVSLRSRFVVCSTDSNMEVMYRLQSYGIPIQLLPMTETNSIKCINLNQWIKSRKLLEAQEFVFPKTEHAGIHNCFGTASESSMFVECPGLNDVVFRKGSRVTSTENPGNRIFRDLIRDFLMEKKHVSEQLNQEVPKFGVSETVPDDVGSNSNSCPAQSKETANLHQKPVTGSNLVPRANMKTGKSFCAWLVDYIERERKGRFLEWDATIDGWVVMRDKIQIARKASVTLYNWGKRFCGERTDAKRPHQRPGLPTLVPNSANPTGDNSNDSSKRDDFNPYRFINGNRPPFEKEEKSCIPSSHPRSIHQTAKSSTIGKKRPRLDESVQP